MRPEKGKLFRGTNFHKKLWEQELVQWLYKLREEVGKKPPGATRGIESKGLFSKELTIRCEQQKIVRVQDTSEVLSLGYSVGGHRHIMQM